ncbi:PoNe immunity protein domain-containing protein [Reinekea sp. G2M2-21]|uniref:PoNe immunity protein domain-containing protein n=1 Tax=Reinekea sp. G2M2-21 TaxID=2788942 RepID=UPI0018A8C479|nr:PoNe immunity protein domain-containing protein [Reinekea sp. G2M2-21]
MANRQNFVSTEHLVDYSEYLKTVPDRFLTSLKTATESDHIESLTRNILKRRVSYLICSYTLGTEPFQLSSIGKTILKDVIRYIESNSRKSDLIAPDNILEQYIQCTWILSFAYFFNAEKSEVEKNHSTHTLHR